METFHMLKKALINAILFVCANTLTFANTVTIRKPFDTIPWILRHPGETWTLPNPGGKTRISFTVQRYLTSRPGVLSDTVTVVCGNTYAVTAGNSIACTLTNFTTGSFRVLPQNFRKGAEGTYTFS
jgi:hypothetical protein